MLTRQLVDAYLFFREYGGCQGEVALSLARAELRGKELGLLFRWEDEDERYEDVYGEPMPEGCVGPFWVACYGAEHEDRLRECDGYTLEARRRPMPLSCLGMVCLVSSRDSYRRVIEAELASEALDVLDARDTVAAAELAERPTFAGVMP